MKKKCTIYDVAKIAGVSPSTVSRVMNSPEIVAEDTRQKVANTVKELSYIPNMMAASMPRKQYRRFCNQRLAKSAGCANCLTSKEL